VRFERALLAALASAALLAARCGKKGEPAPPLPKGPNAVKDLSVEQEGGEAVLTFSYPDRLLDGRPLSDLDSIEIYRLPGATPSQTQPSGSTQSGAGTGALDRAPGSAARRTATKARINEQGFYRDAVPVARLPVAELARRTRGATIVYREDLLPLFAKAGSASSQGYAVVSVRRTRDRSPLSNIAIIAPEIPPGPPEILAVTAEEGRVCLEWLPPGHDMAGKPAVIGGYKVYRRALLEDEYGDPITPAPWPGTAYIDLQAPYDGPIVYTVRATLPGKPRIEGLPAAEAGLNYRDIYPPPSPRRLDALSEGKLVRLFWDPVGVADLEGYIVFRAEGESIPVRLTPQPIKDSFLTDEAVKARVRYRYTVRAIDRAGNISPPSPEAIAEPF
jgi:hypothetical protein